MLHRIALLSTVCAALLFSGGCTAALYEHANKEETRDNLVSSVTAAHIGETGEITICAVGFQAERSREAPPESFGLVVPVQLFESGGESAPVLTGPENEIRIYRLTAERIAEDCPDDVENMVTLPLRQFSPEYLSSVSRSEITYEMLEPFIDETQEGAMLYVFQFAGPDQAAVLVYRHDTPVFDGSRLVRIELPSETVKPNSAAVIALPLAVAADAAAIVVIVLGLTLGAVAAIM